MKPQTIATSLALLGANSIASAQSNKPVACPLLGQQYLPPVDIASQSKFQQAAKGLDATLDGIVKSAPYKGTTFSIGMFSTSEDDLFYQYHHTGQAVADSKYGTNKADADSIYRIGSISKLLTVYLFLLNEGDVRWSDPISKHLPELLKYKDDSWNAITPDWDAITIGDIAGQMGGLARDYGLGDIAPPTNGLATLPDSVKAAFPDIPAQQVPTCGWSFANQTFVQCSVEEYLTGLANESPIFSTAYTPAYANEGFALLGLVLQRIAGTPIETLFNDTLSKPLGLSNTYFDVPDGISEHDVIPGDPTVSGWSSMFGAFGPAGGYYSTVNDFAKFGKDILSSSNLSKAVTKRWMKPTSFVEDFKQGVGRPWEIFRTKVNGQSVEIYSKSGDWGVYHTFFGLSPYHDIGFTLLTAETLSNSAVRNELPFSLIETVLPVLDEVAKDQTETNFAGRYSDKATNSSLTLTTGGSQTGLKITGWISNGVDLYAFLAPQVPNLVWRLLPNQLDYSDKQVGFTSYYASAAPPNATANTLEECAGWFDVDELTYGNIPLGQIVFDVDGSGKATTAHARALRAIYKRES